MIIKQSDLLARARAEGWAVGSFDVVSIASALGVIDALERANSPAAMAISGSHFEYVDFEILAPALVAAAQQASVPLVLHLDHSPSLGVVSRALGLGFTSVMYDGVGQPWDQYTSQVRVIAEMAHAYGAVVEGALSEQSKASTENPQSQWSLPTRELAEEYVAATGIDVLGIGDGQASFDVSRVAELSAVPGLFTSLHGGSGLTDQQIVDLRDAGVAKFSVFSRIAASAMAAARDQCNTDSADLFQLDAATRRGYGDAVAAQLKRFGSVGRA